MKKTIKILFAFCFVLSAFCAHAQMGAAYYDAVTKTKNGVLVASGTLTTAQKANVAHTTLSCKYIRADIVTSNWTGSLPGITAYSKALTADMTTLADAATGIDVCGSADEYVPDPNNAGQTMLNPLLVGKTYMYDFEMFAALMYQPSVVATICTMRIQYAASVGQLD